MPQIDIQDKYNKWLAGFGEVYARWDKTGLLAKLKDDYHRRMVAMALENQRLINEHEVYQNTDTGDNWVARFKRMSIPLVRRVYGGAPFVDWVGFQVKLSPTDALWFQEGGIIQENPIQAKTRRLRTRYPGFDQEEVKKHAYVLDYEAERVAQTALDLADEISREVILDLSNNSKKMTFTRKEYEPLTDFFKIVFAIVNNNLRTSVGDKHTWVVVSPFILQELRDSAEEYGFVDVPKSLFHGNVFLAGTKGQLKVYCDSEAPSNKMLFGYRGSWLDAGYYYLPYIPFTVTPVTLNPDTFEPIQGITTRYAKYLKKGGGKYYYRLVEVENVLSAPEPDQLEEDGPLGLATVIVLQKRELDGDTSHILTEPGRPGEVVRESEQQPEQHSPDCEHGGADQCPGQVETGNAPES